MCDMLDVYGMYIVHEHLCVAFVVCGRVGVWIWCMVCVCTVYRLVVLVYDMGAFG